jgi:hypothetical protein
MDFQIYRRKLESVLSHEYASAQLHDMMGKRATTHVPNRVQELSAEMSKEIRRALNSGDTAAIFQKVVAKLETDRDQCRMLLSGETKLADFLQPFIESVLTLNTPTGSEPRQVCLLLSSQNFSIPAFKGSISPVIEIQEFQRSAKAEIPPLMTPISKQMLACQQATETRNFSMLFTYELRDYLCCHGKEHSGSRRELVSRCVAYQQEINCQNALAEQVSAEQDK